MLVRGGKRIGLYLFTFSRAILCCVGAGCFAKFKFYVGRRYIRDYVSYRCYILGD